MKTTEFCYWLQGFFELRAAGSPVKELSGDQVDMIERHLALVFQHDIDPKQGTPEQQASLQEIHDGKKPQIGRVGPGRVVYRC